MNGFGINISEKILTLRYTGAYLFLFYNKCIQTYFTRLSGEPADAIVNVKIQFYYLSTSIMFKSTNIFS